MGSRRAPFREGKIFQLFKEISSLVEGLPVASSVDSIETGGACLWLSDVKKLKDLRHKYRRLEDRYPFILGGIFEVMHWREVLARATEMNEEIPSPPSKRQRLDYSLSGDECAVEPSKGSLVIQCRQRDQGCVLTKMNPLVCEATHLFPEWMNDDDATESKSFWNTLSMFWSEERVQKWRTAIFGSRDDPCDGQVHGGTERLENVICLSPVAHALYRDARFALKPVDRDPEGRWMTLRFQWLKPQCHRASTIDLLTPPDLPDDFDPESMNMGIGLRNVLTDQPVRSGDIIKLETANPQTHPLPDVAILDLQWIMNRVAVLSGGVE